MKFKYILFQTWKVWKFYIFCVEFGNIMEFCDVLSPKCDIDWVVLNLTKVLRWKQVNLKMEIGLKCHVFFVCFIKITII